MEGMGGPYLVRILAFIPRIYKGCGLSSAATDEHYVLCYHNCYVFTCSNSIGTGCCWRQVVLETNVITLSKVHTQISLETFQNRWTLNDIRIIISLKYPAPDLWKISFGPNLPWCMNFMKNINIHRSIEILNFMPLSVGNEPTFLHWQTDWRRMSATLSWRLDRQGAAHN